MKNAYKVLLLVAFTGIALGEASVCYACSCIASTEAEHFERSEAVFVGVVTSRHDPNEGAELMSSGDPITWTFDVQTTAKGSTANPQEIRSARDGATCGFNFTVGERYKVYSYRGEDGAFWTNICGGTRVATVSDLATPAAPPLSRPDPRELPETGASILVPLAAGLLSLILGIFLVSRRRATGKTPA